MFFKSVIYVILPLEMNTKQSLILNIFLQKNIITREANTQECPAVFNYYYYTVM